jgi:Ca2+-binding EF-hand superfamily protein
MLSTTVLSPSRTTRFDHDLRGQSLPGVSDSDIRQSFRLVDLDKDGQISARDLRIFLESIGEEPSHSEIAEMVRMMDQAKDGYVHLSEFTDLFFECNRDGSENRVYEEALPSINQLRTRSNTTTTKTAPSDALEQEVKRFISRIPGAMSGSPWIRRDVLKDIIGRWKALKEDMLTEKHFFELLQMKRSDYGERIFSIFSNHHDTLDVKQFILILGAFVAAPCEERMDFACRVLDEAGSGLLIEEQVEALLKANFIGVKVDIRAKMDKIMRESDSNSLVSRRHLIQITKSEPNFIFPTGRIEYPTDLGSYGGYGR